MAKKSNKRRKNAGGGGFGGGAKPKAPAGGDRFVDIHELTEARREHERMMKAVQQAAATRNFKSPEELTRFLNENLTGRPMAEIIDDLETEPFDDLGRATRMMDELPDNAPPEQVRRTAQAALAISQNCLEAWLDLGIIQQDPAKAMECFEQGIERGRRRFAEWIDSLDGRSGLWGNVEARPLMRLYHELAIQLENMERDDEALVVYQEMLRLNPHDNQGVRGSLLQLLVLSHKWEEADALFARFPRDGLIDMVYGRALLAILNAMDATGADVPAVEDTDDLPDPGEILASLGPEFDEARKALTAAVKANPYVALLMYQPHLFRVEAPEMVTIGGPCEAFAYAQRWAVIWHATALPLVLLQVAAESHVKDARINDLHAAEMSGILEVLNDQDGTPWWDEMENE